MNVSKEALNLKQFILRQQVKNLYRRILRSIRDVPDKYQQQELREWARSDFDKNRHLKDEMAIKMLINYGERSLKELQTSLNLVK